MDSRQRLQHKLTNPTFSFECHKHLEFPTTDATMTTTNKKDNQDIEGASSFHDEGPEKNHTDYRLVDKEVAKYATDTAIHIDEATNKRLRRMIDKRILVVMMFTYLIQTLDKGAMSFASIMGIMEDAHLADNQVSYY